MNKKNEKENKRINDIIKSIKKVSEGDYSVKLKIASSNDDIDKLAAILNEMVANVKNKVNNLRSSCEKMEEVVSERNELEEMWRRYEFIINTSKNFMSLIGIDYTYEAVNDAYCIAQNKARENFIGKTVTEVWGHKIFKKTIKERLDRCINGSEVNFQEWFTFGDLGQRYMDVTYYPYTSNIGKITNVVVVSRDITEKKNAYDELRNSEERFKIIFDYAPDPYYINDMQGNFVEGNIAAERILGYKKEELVGQNFLKLKILPPKQIFKAAKILAKNVLKKSTGPDEFILNRKDGTQVALEISTFPIILKNQSVVLGIARDISKRKMADEELKKYREKLEELVQDRTEELTIVNKKLKQEIEEREKSDMALRKSEEKYRMITENSIDGIIQIDKTGKFIFVNRAAQDLSGFESNEFLGKNFQNFIAEKDLSKSVGIFKKLLTGENIQDELTCIHKLGHEYIIHFTAVPIKENSKVVGLTLIMRDITEQKTIAEKLKNYQEHLEVLVNERTSELTDLNEKLKFEISERKITEFELQESKNRYHTFINSTSDIVFLKDDEFKNLIINRAFKDFVGMNSDDEIIGKTDFDLMPLSIAENCKESDIETVKQGKIIVTEQTFGDKIYETRKFPVIISDDKTGIGGYIRDITDRKNAEIELERATAQLIQSEKLSALGELTAGIAHETNQPLNVIKIICQSIIRDFEKKDFNLNEEELKDDLYDIEKQVNKMSQVIDHMRIFTRQSDGVTREDVDINNLIEEPFKLIGTQLKVHDIKLTKKMASDMPIIKGNAIQLEQVVLNLISNAKYAVEVSKKENKMIEVITCKDDDRSEVIIEVKDNGEGIPDDLKEKIFQPFITTKEAGKGTGLGLSISSKIIKEHGGYIELDSKVGEGSTFRVVLPFVQS